MRTARLVQCVLEVVTARPKRAYRRADPRKWSGPTQNMGVGFTTPLPHSTQAWPLRGCPIVPAVHIKHHPLYFSVLLSRS